MATNHEATIRSFFDVWVERDPARLTEFFADDGSWSEANRPAAVGHEEIRAVFEMQTSFGSEFSFEFRNLAVVGDTVFTERVDRFSLNDTPMTVHVAGVFELGPDGRVRAWRDYYDWADLERQLVAAGVDMGGA
ncbi:MAG TPA: limonene-1,2-epoxide hydrolase family protein [Acidimicrobiales bacterium]|nr:limonene-1,2-epoxide hydrolase family protein [Acidimicrobiales bacterium]